MEECIGVDSFHALFELPGSPYFHVSTHPGTPLVNYGGSAM
jgi:hypothetical protein